MPLSLMAKAFILHRLQHLLETMPLSHAESVRSGPARSARSPHALQLHVSMLQSVPLVQVPRQRSAARKKALFIPRQRSALFSPCMLPTKPGLPQAALAVWLEAA